MEARSGIREIFTGRKVLVTGHTGFKGSWLCEWLLLMGAKVSGLGLEPPTSPALFDQLGLASRMDHRIGDIRDAALVADCVKETNPEFIFHLAAQALVRLSYREPLETYATNVLGTAHVLEAVRALGGRRVVICVTTDKCYENREWLHAYREEDPLGGHDPYSSSKAAAELVISAYRDSFFRNTDVALASARAGNVIGGGDWALDRIVPDSMRALDAGEAVPVRNRHATRPWQHVLEPLGGYLALAGKIFDAQARRSADELRTLCSAFNFGPLLDSNQPVSTLVTEILKHRSGSWVDQSDPAAPHEAGRLNLSIDRAFHLLGWLPVWNFKRTVAETTRWYIDAAADDLPRFTRTQIETYLADAAQAGLSWAR
jgi:CDP-glucose 4,6-dehydratase